MIEVLVLTGNRESASFQYRIEQYLAILTAHGIHCTVEVIPATAGRRRHLFRQASQWHGVLLHRKLLTWHDAWFLRRYAKVIVYDFDDAIMVRPDPSKGPSLVRRCRFARTLKTADHVIAGNLYLADLARQFNPQTAVLPTGVDVAVYEGGRQPPPEGASRLVWIGSHSTLRYLEQIRPALEETGHRFPGVRLRIISDRFMELDHMPVEKCLWSRQGHAGPLRSSDIGLAPLPDDAFTRGKCGFKVLQYLACGLPVITSPVGVNKELVSHGITGFHATTMAEWVDYVGRLVENQALRAEMGIAAKAAVQRYGIGPVGKQLAELIMAALQGH